MRCRIHGPAGPSQPRSPAWAAGSAPDLQPAPVETGDQRSSV